MQGIVDDERPRDRPQPPSAQRVGAGRAHLFVAPPRRCLGIDSSSRLDLVSVALPTYVIVFMVGSTKDRGPAGGRGSPLPRRGAAERRGGFPGLPLQ